MTTLSFDILWRDRGAEKGMRQLGQATEKTHHSFRALKVGAGIALVAAGAAAVKFGTSSVKAYVEAQTAQVKLQDAFRKFPKLADTNISSLRKLNTELAKKTRFDDDATASGQAVLAQFNLTGQQITKLTPLMQDYAAKTGKDLPAAAGVLGKAFLGNTKALKAIGINYKSTGDAGKDFTNIQKLVNEKVGGFAEKEGKSAAGQAAILKNQFGELQETAGKQLLPALLKVGSGLLKLIGFVQSNSAIFKTLGKTVKIIFKSLAESVGAGKLSFKDFADFVATHQEDITQAIIKGGKGFVKFGIVMAKVASGALRAFGGLSDGINHVVSFIINQYAVLATGAATAFGWIPGIGPKMVIAAAKFRVFAAHAAADIGKTGDSARRLADGIDKKVLPGLDKAGKSLDAYGKKAIASARAKDILARAEIKHRDASAAAMKAAKENGKTLDANTAKGKANRTALNGLVSSSQAYIQKLVDTGAKSKTVTARTKDAKEEFIRVAAKMGLGSKAAKDLAEKYFKIPKKRETKIEQPGMTPSQKAAISYERKLAAIRKNVDSKVAVKFGSSGKVALHIGGRQYIANATGGVLPGFTPGRDVHTFQSMSPGVPDLKLSGGEAIMRPEWTRAVGGAPAVARMNRAAVQGNAAAYASGGVVPSMYPATHAPGVAERAGAVVARQAAMAVSATVMAVLKKQAAAAAAAGGGPVGKGGYASALRYARAHRGHPYIFGSLWDCSGFMSALHSIILGQRPHRRYTTTAFHGAHAAGFTRGKSSPFRVGVRPLSGKFGHMAGTLNGVNVESSGGVGVRVGGGARGAGSGMFSWRGGLAKGGVIGDLPYDLLDPHGQRYNPELAALVHRAGYHRGGAIGSSGAPERVLSTRQNVAFERLVRVMDRGHGAGATTIINIHAPNYIGSRDELRQMLVEMNRRGQLEVIKR